MNKYVPLLQEDFDHEIISRITEMENRFLELNGYGLDIMNRINNAWIHENGKIKIETNNSVIVIAK